MEFQVGGLKIHHEESAHASMRCNSFLYERFYDKLKKNCELIPNNCLKTYSSNFCPYLAVLKSIILLVHGIYVQTKLKNCLTLLLVWL